jgi:hypothetical protein
MRIERGQPGLWQAKLATLTGAACFMAFAWVLMLRPSQPCLTDYANWTYQGVLFAEHLRGVADATHLLKPYPVPNSASTLMIGLLATALPWPLAAKGWLCLQLAISFLSLRHLLRTLGGNAYWLWLVVPQCVFLNVNFWYGFVNFQLGLCWVLLMASMLLRRCHRAEPQRNWVLGLLLVAAFFTHMIPFAFCSLLVVLYTLQTRRWSVLPNLLPGVVLTVWYMFGRYVLAHNADGHTAMQTVVRDYSAGFWAFKVNSYLKSFGFVNPGDAVPQIFGRAGHSLLLAINLALAALVAVALIRRGSAAWREKACERFLWAGIFALVPVYLLTPGTALGISDPGARLLQTGLMLGIILSLRDGSRLVRVAAACSGVLMVAGFCLFLHCGAEGTPSAGSVMLRSPALSSGQTRLSEFAHVPNDDQDYFYLDLRRGRMDDDVFPTGMFLNQPIRKPAQGH